MTTATALPSDAPRPRLLCVDDDERLLRGLRRMLRKDYELTLSTSGQEALDLMATESFDLLLTDMRMPGISGAELCVAACKIAPNTPRVLLTGYADPESIALAWGSGGIFRAVDKPCSKEALLEVLSAAANSRD